MQRNGFKRTDFIRNRDGSQILDVRHKKIRNLFGVPDSFAGYQGSRDVLNGQRYAFLGSFFHADESDSFEDGCNALPATDTHRYQSITAASALQLVNSLGGNERT